MTEARAGTATALPLVAPVEPSRGSLAVLRPLSSAEVSIDGGLWAERRGVVREVSLRCAAEELERSGTFENFRRAARGEAGGYRGREFNDSDVYKWLEAAGWAIAHGPDPGLEQLADDAIELVEAAQLPDGYVNTYCQLVDPSWRFTDLAQGHELYCAGHLFQAAVAHSRARGNDRLLAVARRFADYLVDIFGEGKREGLCGHAEIETALVELYRLTAEPTYLGLANAFLDRRGRGLLEVRRFDAAYFQDDVPVREGRRLRGHAVRAFYLGAGVVDAYLETGDESLLAAAVAQWEDAVAAKTYLTGGVGSRHEDEAVGDPYELPPDRAYCETCASIASVMFSWRLLLATGEARYADLIERTLYNGVLAGLSLDGRRFFYVNPLQSRGGHGRSRWPDVACCPPNVMRLLSSLEHYVATVDDGGLQLHQFASGAVRASVERGPIAVEVATRYPWEGRIELTVHETPDQPWTLSLRVPSWCREATLAVPDADTAAPTPGAYAAVARRWSPGDRVVLDLAMPPRLTRPDPRIDAVRGCLAVERGPLVYCVERADLPDRIELEEVELRPDASLSAVERPDVLGGVVAVETDGVAGRDDRRPAWPYAEADGDSHAGRGADLRLSAIPYFAWANRGEGSMRVWIPTARGGGG
jgi:DUF1680 family protein